MKSDTRKTNAKNASQTVVGIRMSKMLREQFLEHCRANDTTMSQQVRRFMREKLAAAKTAKN